MTLNDGTVIGKCTNFHDVHLGVVDPEPVKFSDLDPTYQEALREAAAVKAAAEKLVEVIKPLVWTAYDECSGDPHDHRLCISCRNQESGGVHGEQGDPCTLADALAAVLSAKEQLP